MDSANFEVKGTFDMARGLMIAQIRSHGNACQCEQFMTSHKAAYHMATDMGRVTGCNGYNLGHREGWKVLEFSKVVISKGVSEQNV